MPYPDGSYRATPGDGVSWYPQSRMLARLPWTQFRSRRRGIRSRWKRFRIGRRHLHPPVLPGSASRLWNRSDRRVRYGRCTRPTPQTRGPSPLLISRPTCDSRQASETSPASAERLASFGHRSRLKDDDRRLLPAQRSVAVEILVQFAPALPQPFTFLAHRCPAEHLAPDPAG
jgi:hypothetical protein